MSIPLDREGTFRGQITEYGLYENPSTGTLSIRGRVRIDEFWNGESWEDWRQYDVEHGCFFNIVKGNGETNRRAVADLVSHTGWDGTLASIINNSWSPAACQLIASINPNDEQKRIGVGGVRAFDADPSATGSGFEHGNVDVNKAKALEAKYGSALRAVAGTVKRNATPPPNGKPMPKPSKPAAPPAAAPAAAALPPRGEPAPQDEIPF